MIKFVIEPYGKVLNLIPDDKIFVDSVTAKWSDKKTRIEKASEYEKKGIIVYDKILEISERILLNDNVFGLFANRLQYLFIDEYQDNRIKTHKIWLNLIQQNKTKVYLIGDPLQHIFKFTYDLTHLASEELPISFHQTPLKEFKENYPASVVSLEYNRRSSKNIIDFINYFILEEKHKQILHDDNKDNQIPVYFIATTSPVEILKKYHSLKDLHKISELHKSSIFKTKKNFFEDFYLTSRWIDGDFARDFKEIYNQINSYCSHLVKGKNILTSTLQETSRNILGVAEITKSDFIENIYDEIEYRKMCFDFLENLKNKTYEQQKEDIKNLFNRYFFLYIDIKNTNGAINQSYSMSDLTKEQKNNQSSFFSTVQSSKGLEATSVLVITENNQELNDWLDFEKSNSELDDKYRLGYVAFSRARDMLCISCLGNVDSSLIEKLENLNVHIVR